jgi:hypothetical protein
MNAPVKGNPHIAFPPRFMYSLDASLRAVRSAFYPFLRNVLPMIKLFTLLTASLLLLPACQPRPVATQSLNVATSALRNPSPEAAQPSETIPTLPDATATQPPRPTTIPAATATSTPGATPHILVHADPGEPYTVTMSIPVGAGGIRYLGGGVDSFVEGPNAVAILSDGVFAISDPVDSRIVLAPPAGEPLSSIPMLPLGIHIISDMVAIGDELFILEVGFGPMPETNHIYRITREGELLQTYTLPPWASIAGGIGSLDTGTDGSLYLWMNGQQKKLYRVIDGAGKYFPTLVQGFPYQEQVYWTYGARGMAGNIPFATRLSEDMGSIRLLAINNDGSFFVVREDAVMINSTIQVDVTVHYMSPSARQIGVARLPINDAYYYVPRNLAVSPDGTVYALLPRRQQVDIVGLEFYTRLDPLLPGMVEPLVTTTQDN